MSGRDGGAVMRGPELVEMLLAEILRDGHRYARGTEQYQPTLAAQPAPRRRRARTFVRERQRDVVERAAARFGYSHPHFHPATAAARLSRILALSDGLATTYDDLGDEHARRAFLDVLKLRVLGPYHAPLRVTPEEFRARQREVDQTLRIAPNTGQTADPLFSRLSLYRVPVAGGEVTLHGHSVDIVSVFLLSQYGYAAGGSQVLAGPGDVVADIGACWGDTALYFASLVGPTGKVYAFEPDPANRAVLMSNLQLNPGLSGRIEVVGSALWESSDETLRFAPGGRTTTLVAADSGVPSTEVRTITFDDFVDQAGLERLSFVKMDVEGAEAPVLRGAAHALRRFAPKLAIAAYHNDDDLVRIPEMIRALDLDYHLYLESSSPVEEETVLFGTVA